MLEAANGAGDMGSAKVVVETGGATQAERDEACEQARGVVRPDGGSK